MAFIPAIFAAIGSTITGVTAASAATAATAASGAAVAVAGTTTVGTAAAAAITATNAMVGALAVSAGVSTIGMLASSHAQANSYRMQAYAAENNAALLRANGQVAAQEANAREEALRRNYGRLQGEALAGIAQSGTGFSGSNLDLLKQNDTYANLDALTIRYEGEQAKRGLLAQASQSEYEALAYKQNAKATRQAGYLNAGANLLSSYAKYKGLG